MNLALELRKNVYSGPITVEPHLDKTERWVEKELFSIHSTDENNEPVVKKARLNE